MVRTQSFPSGCPLGDTMTADILQFVSRKEQLSRRDVRKFGHWMMLVKGRVNPNGPEASEWREQELLERKADAEWAKRHGTVDGERRVAQFPTARREGRFRND